MIVSEMVFIISALMRQCIGLHGTVQYDSGLHRLPSINTCTDRCF